jgi:hypothetical protein
VKSNHEIFLFLCYINFRTYRASSDKKDDVAPASHNLSHVHKLILEIQKKFKDQEQERKQMEVCLVDFSQFNYSFIRFSFSGCY